MATYDVSSFVVTAEWLKNKMEDTSYDLVILDTSYSSSADKNAEEEYKKCHIPGARFFDLDYKAPKTPDFLFNIPSSEDFQEYARSLGVNNTSHVVVYDNSGNGGFYYGARTWYTFILYGLTKVSVVDNGIHEWKNNGYQTTDELPAPKIGDFVANRRDHLYRQMAEIQDNLTSKKFVVLDARSDKLFQGDPEEPRSGHIPGSINMPFGSKLLDPATGRIRSTEYFKNMFAEYGMDLTKPIVASCKGGMAGCTLMMALMMAGATNYSLYHGSSTEWLRNANLENIAKSEDTRL